ncbi:MAG: general secretion pathway protein GspK [Burkholderiaceae bacterium]|nr:general secretion pathway protein GspK [Burkholderiaceae bacterium]
MMQPTQRPKRHPDHGIALIAVLWIVAALSVIVTGVVHSVRAEVRLVTAARQSIEAVALGEAAIMLVLQDMVSRNDRPVRWSRTELVYQDRPVVVELMPLTGLIDINNAPEPLLARLYAVAGGLDVKAATALAATTVQVRSERDGRGRMQGFEATQDLLRLPGMGYDLYARLSRLITAESQGMGRVNAQAAPEEVLAVLADGNAAQASALANRRASSGTDIDTTALNGEFIGNTPSTRYRLQAQVVLPDGALVFVSRSLDLRADPRLGLPWRIFNAEHWMQAPPAKGV